MIDFSLIASVALIHLLAVISPGPDFFLTLKNSLTYSRKSGIYTAIGFGLGISIHIIYSIAGLALLISKSILVFNLIKYLGVAFILYLGIMSFISPSKEVKVEKQSHKKDISPLKAISQGFLTNVLNPKATLFFLSLFTLVISPDTSKTTIYIISGIMAINTSLWFTLVAIFMTQIRIRKIYNHYQKHINKIFGGILIALGLKIAFDS